MRGLVKELEVETRVDEELLGRIEVEIVGTLVEDRESKEVLLLLMPPKVLLKVLFRVLLMPSKLVDRLLRDMVLEDEVAKLLVKELPKELVEEVSRLLVDELELDVVGVTVVLPLELEVLELEEIRLSVLDEAVSVLEDEELAVVGASVDEDEVEDDVVRIEVVEESVGVEESVDVEEVEEEVEVVTTAIPMVEDDEEEDEVEM